MYLLQVLAGCGVYDGSEVHEASAWVFSTVFCKDFF